MSKIIDGKIISDIILKKMADKVVSLKKNGITPCLSVILVGDDAASQVYVRNKELACEQVGILSKTFRLPTNTSQEDLECLIDDLNNDKSINGILLQLPLPKHLNEEKAISKISDQKDVDGFHIINTGKLMRGIDCIMPCTPKGCIEMLNYISFDCKGKHAVIVGRSNLVGKPLAIMLLQKDATVTVCHSKTINLKDITKQADILVVAIGKPKFITEDMVKEGAVILDVGINRINGKLCGDVDFDNCYEKASYITPVPGGVGKMTIAMLISNTLDATCLQYGINK